MKAIELTAERAPEFEKKKINGVEFHVAVSPYFLPQRLNCHYLEQEGILQIAFQYLDNEPADDRIVEQGMVSFSIGKHTRKILKMRIEVDRHNVDQAHLRVQEALGAMSEQETVPDRQVAANHEAAENAVRDHEEELEGLVTA